MSSDTKLVSSARVGLGVTPVPTDAEAAAIVAALSVIGGRGAHREPRWTPQDADALRWRFSLRTW